MSDSAEMIDRLENLVITASEGGKDAWATLTKLILDTPVLPKEMTAFLSSNLELIFPDDDAVLSDDAKRALAFDMAAKGVDAMVLRDAISSFARSTHSEYPDPAGMIKAVGVLNQSISISEVMRRLNAFGHLKEGVAVWHDSFGFGDVREIDAFSGLIYVHFSGSHNFGLEQALTHLSVVLPDSFADVIYRKPDSFDKKISPDEFDAKVAESFAPKLVSPRQVVEALLVPRHLTHGAFLGWREKSTSTSQHRKPVGSSTPEPADKSVLPDLPDPNDAITWENARSLQELQLELGNVKSVSLKDAHIEHLAKLYAYAAGRPKFAMDLVKSLIALTEKSDSDEALQKLVDRLPKDAAIWTDDELFVTTSVKLKVREMERWLKASLMACGKEWFLSHLTLLPARFWTQGENILAKANIDLSELKAVAVAKFQEPGCKPDVPVWLWKHQVEEAMPIFSNPRVVFNVLADKCSGEFIKAHKALHNMIMNDEDFQSALMDGGDLHGIETFVKAVRATKSIDLGERQSLLVKIVRQFPEAKPFVEERRGRPTVRKMRRMSSFRSIKALREELEDITNKQIPENSAAIAQARSYGDLRENFEFKAAKERQRLLNARKKEIERDLGDVMGTDFSDVEIENVVIPGCTIELDVEGKTESYQMLGLWDSEPERGIISYETPLGQALIGKSVGETVELPQGKTGTVKALHALPEETVKWMQAED